MGTPYLGEIKIVSFNFAPRGWATCSGQLLAINQNQALFSILGTTYGGDGRTNFALPDFRGRVPIYSGQGIVLGQKGGEESHTVQISEMPAHSHVVTGANTGVNAGSPLGNNFGALPGAYATSTTGSMAPNAIANAGGSQPHENRPPYLVLTVIIALQGIFPSRN